MYFTTNKKTLPGYVFGVNTDSFAAYKGAPYTSKLPFELNFVCFPAGSTFTLISADRFFVRYKVDIPINHSSSDIDYDDEGHAVQRIPSWSLNEGMSTHA